MSEIRHLKNEDIDYQKWNACIYNSANGHIYAYSWYLDLMSPEWEALVYDDYIMVMPLPQSQKWRMAYVFQPYFVQQLGVFSPIAIHQEDVHRFLHAIPSHFRYIDYYLNEGNSIDEHFFTGNYRENYLLPLSRPYEEIYANYNKNTKRKLKKAKQNSLKVEQSQDVELALSTFRKEVGPKTPELTDAHYEQIRELMRKTLENYIGYIYIVRNQQQEVCASLFLITSHQRLIYLFPASTTIGKKTAAMALLIDTLVQEHQNTPTILDFEGSMIPSIAQFFKGFGATATNYYHLRWNKLPWLLKWMKP